MDLKAVYHYTYFIYPFLISKRKYRDFLCKCLSDPNWNMNIHDRQVDLNTYAYFLPYVKKFLFPTSYWSENYIRQFENMQQKKKQDVVSELTSVSFEYNIHHNYKADYGLHETDINFEIKNIKLICFESGVSFLIFKAELANEDGITAYEVMDFNYKFRTINPRYIKKMKTEGMYLKNREFGDTEDLSSFINSLLYGFEEVEKESIYFDRLFTYSYMCLDEKEWNEETDFAEIINEFYKFQYVLPGNYGSTFDPDYKGSKDNTYTRWKYSIYGFSRESGVVLSSEREKFNITKLPYYFEHMYFYIFLLAFYQRISLILFSEELLTGDPGKAQELKNKFTRFTHFSWFSQITNSEQGMDIWKKWQKAFDLPALFDEVQKEYSEFYEYIVARGQERINWLLIIIYTVSVLFTGITLLVDFRIIDTDNAPMKVLVEAMLGLTVWIYPLYLFIRWIVIKIMEKKRREVS